MTYNVLSGMLSLYTTITTTATVLYGCSLSTLLLDDWYNDFVAAFQPW